MADLKLIAFKQKPALSLEQIAANFILRNSDNKVPVYYSTIAIFEMNTLVLLAAFLLGLVAGDVFAYFSVFPF